MSHFTVLVIGENPEDQLAPFQENNMEDCPPEYLSFTDQEDEFLEEYREGSTDEFYDSSSSSWGLQISQKEFEFIKNKNIGDSNLAIGIDDMIFFDRPTVGRRYKCGVSIDHRPPEEFVWIKVDAIVHNTASVTKIEEPERLLHKEKYKTFEEFCEEYHGHDKRDPQMNRYGYWSNIDKFDENGVLIGGSRWDWYEMGGRWTGYFKLKSKPKLALPGKVEGFTDAEILNFVKLHNENPQVFKRIVTKYKGKEKIIKKLVQDYNNPELEIESFPEHEVGRPGLMTEPAKIGYADQVRKIDVDFEAMREEARQRARDKYAMFEKFFAKFPQPRSWKSLLEDVESKKIDINTAREIYHGQPRQLQKEKLLQNKSYNLTEEERSFVLWINLDEFLIDKETYIENAGFSAISTFAVIKDGKWYERGKMGWWACVSDEKSSEEWETKFDGLLDSLSDDTLLTIFDCHI